MNDFEKELNELEDDGVDIEMGDEDSTAVSAGVEDDSVGYLYTSVSCPLSFFFFLLLIFFISRMSSLAMMPRHLLRTHGLELIAITRTRSCSTGRLGLSSRPTQMPREAARGIP